MKVLNVRQIRECDQYTIEHEPISSIDLMERAARQLYSWIKERFGPSESIIVFAGTGNNGGDALALSRMLFHEGYQNIQVYLLHTSQSLSADCKANYERLMALNPDSIEHIYPNDHFPDVVDVGIIIDGIFGSGLNRVISGYWVELVNHINQNSTEIISIDIPSGLFAEDNRKNNGAIVQATFTLTFQCPKIAFFFAENELYVGDWEVIDIGLHPDGIEGAITSYYYVQPDDILTRIKRRHKFAHKGTFGHAFLIAGSYQKTGAAVLAARACLKTGVGLLTVHIPETGYEIVQTAVPEAMLCIDETEFSYCDPNNLQRYSAIGIGPGIGTKKSMKNAFRKLLENQTTPMVIDADAINILAENPDWLRSVPMFSILTPHPGEFDRLTKKHDTAYDRLTSQMAFSDRHNVYVVLKGAFTSITTPDGRIYFNSTGNPGMATAGSGDALTGIILSLLAQGYQPRNAAILGVFIHGYAGDLAKEQMGEEALIASDIINNLGLAFKKLKEL